MILDSKWFAILIAATATPSTYKKLHEPHTAIASFTQPLRVRKPTLRRLLFNVNCKNLRPLLRECSDNFGGQMTPASAQWCLDLIHLISALDAEECLVSLVISFMAHHGGKEDQVHCRNHWNASDTSAEFVCRTPNAVITFEYRRNRVIILTITCTIWTGSGLNYHSQIWSILFLLLLTTAAFMKDFRNQRKAN